MSNDTKNNDTETPAKEMWIELWTNPTETHGILRICEKDTPDAEEQRTAAEIAMQPDALAQLANNLKELANHLTQTTEPPSDDEG